MLDNPLDQISIATPCKADWALMTGDHRVRFCQECQMKVYNLSGMSRDEAEALITGTEGRLCIRYFKRMDGTILTRDCPVGIKALHHKRQMKAAGIAAAVTFITAAGIFVSVKANSLMGDRAAAKGEMVVGGMMPPPVAGNSSNSTSHIITPLPVPELEHPQNFPVQVAPVDAPKVMMGEMMAQPPIEHVETAHPKTDVP